MELLVLMSLPLAGALLLALLGERRHAAELNVLVSLGTFIAGCKGKWAGRLYRLRDV